MINSAVPVVPVSKLSVIDEVLNRVGLIRDWTHEPVPGGPKYAAFTNQAESIELHASESRGDGTGPVVVYFRVSDVDALAAQAGVTAEDQTWGTREFWLRDADGNTYRFGQTLSSH
jgi:hypothetical protein